MIIDHIAHSSDYLTGAKLASTGYGVEKGPKSRRLQLHGPDEEVAFDLTGRMGFVSYSEH